VASCRDRDAHAEKDVQIEDSVNPSGFPAPALGTQYAFIITYLTTTMQKLVHGCLDFFSLSALLIANEGI